MESESRTLKDTAVAVTGASSGIGRATVRILAEAGCTVFAAARRMARLNELVNELGDNVVACACNVRQPADVDALVHTAVERVGRLDTMVIAAGLGAYGSILDYSNDEIAEMVETNLAGTIWAVRAAVPAMLRSGGGDIVIVASVAGIRGGGNEAVYAATKFGQVGLAGSLDRELRSQGIRVSAICPAAVATEFAMDRGRTPDMPGLDRMLQPEDVATAIRTVLEQPRRMRTQLWSMWSMDEAS